MTRNLADIPPSILAKMPGLGAADEPILSDAEDPSDPINDNIPSVRLAGAFADGPHWAVVYEIGDFANTRMVALFSLTREKKASAVAQRAGRQEADLCAILKGAFANSW